MTIRAEMALAIGPMRVSFGVNGPGMLHLAYHLWKSIYVFGTFGNKNEKKFVISDID